jgi:hypothetical protein
MTIAASVSKKPANLAIGFGRACVQLARLIARSTASCSNRPTPAPASGSAPACSSDLVPMKLIICPACWDVIALRRDETRRCHCGKVSGRYLDRFNAEHNGKGVPIGLNTTDIRQAVKLHLARVHHCTQDVIRCAVFTRKDPRMIISKEPAAEESKPAAAVDQVDRALADVVDLKMDHAGAGDGHYSEADDFEP